MHSSLICFPQFMNFIFFPCFSLGRLYQIALYIAEEWITPSEEWIRPRSSSIPLLVLPPQLGFEITKLIKKLKLNKAPGWDFSSAEAIQNYLDGWKPILASLFTSNNHATVPKLSFGDSNLQKKRR